MQNLRKQKMKTAVIITAAGASRRMGGSIPKQYMYLDGLTVLARSVKAFCDFQDDFFICVTVPAGDVEFVRGMLKKSGLEADAIVEGGSTRQISVYNALKALPEDTQQVLIHDGARPFVSGELIAGVLQALETAKAVVPGVTPKNTIRTAETTLDRSSLYEVQTPQGFDFRLLLKANEQALKDGFSGTDDAGLVERLGVPVIISQGDYANIKITTPEDLPMNIRTGMGYDVHKLVPGRRLFLGCVEIPYEKGLLGHSDADVVSHAIADAILGAAALGDIGRHFPDKDPQYEGMSGTEILQRTAEILRSAGFTLVNVDATLVAEKPKIAPYAAQMNKNTAAALGVPENCVSIKATTEEGMGISGGGEAMASYAVATVR